jgi:site-specific recombinase XerD
MDRQNPQRPKGFTNAALSARLSRWEGKDLSRRRYQRKGYLREKSGSWLLTWREDRLDKDGKLFRDRPTVKIGPSRGAGKLSKREANRIAWELYLEPSNRLGAKPITMATLGEFINGYFMPEHVWTLSYGSQCYYKSNLKHLEPLEGLRLRDITIEDIQGFLRMKIEDQGVSVVTTRAVKKILSAIFSHAEKKGWINGPNWARLAELPKAFPIRERRALNIEQGRTLIIHLPSPSREMAFLSIDTSLGVAEMLGLLWRRINFSDQHIYVDGETVRPWHILVAECVYRGRRGDTKNTYRRRQVPFSEPCAAVLAEWKARCAFAKPDEPVFATSKGRPYSPQTLAARQLKPIGCKLGMPWLSWHVFRRTHTTLGEARGVALSDRRAVMGHAGTEMTLHYTIGDAERYREKYGEIAKELLRGGSVQ